MAIIIDRLLEIAARDCDRELVVDDLHGRLTYGQVAEKVERLAGGLRELDIGPADVVILQLPNWTPFLIFHLALSTLGAVTATIPIVYRTRELQQVLTLTRPKALVVPRKYRGRWSPKKVAREEHERT